MAIFNYLKRSFAIIIFSFSIALILHFVICLDIRKFKIAVSHITKAYTLFKMIFPVAYSFGCISLLIYSSLWNNSKNMYVVLILYISSLILSTLSAFLMLRRGNLAFGLWSNIFNLIIQFILTYILSISSYRAGIFSKISTSNYIYITICNLWLYMKYIFR